MGQDGVAGSGLSIGFISAEILGSIAIDSSDRGTGNALHSGDRLLRQAGTQEIADFPDIIGRKYHIGRCAMFDHVPGVSRWCVPPEIRDAVIEPITVAMASHHPSRLRTCE
jgi:hypothetical protein